MTLAWLLAQGDDIIPIPGSKSIAHIEENIAAVHLILTETEKAEIRRMCDEIERLTKDDPNTPHAFLATAFVDTPPL